MKFPWRTINDIIEKKDFDALYKRANQVNLIYFIMGSVTTYIFDWFIQPLFHH